MEVFANSSFGVFLTSLFAAYFTAPSQQNFLILAYGWSLSTTQHTIASYLWRSGAVSVKHFSRFYFFLSGPLLKQQNLLWAVVIRLADTFIPESAPIQLLIDDFVKKKSGKTISSAESYRNAAGSARQEYRTLWGINFVYGIIVVPTPLGPLAVPVGLQVYLKAEKAAQLGRAYQSRSQKARQIVQLVATTLPHRKIRVTADGGYSTKEFLRNRLPKVNHIGRLPINSQLYELPPPVPKGRRGRKPKKGQPLGSPQTLIHTPGGWKAHPKEKHTRYKEFVAIWHSVLPGVLIRVVVIHRTQLPKRNRKKPEIEAFFSTDLSLFAPEILSSYSKRWRIEIDIRDGNGYGIGGDRCRNYQRIVGINSFRLLLAASRTLWFVGRIHQSQGINLRRFRPWYRQKQYVSQLDVITAFHEVLSLEGISPIVRFLPDLAEIPPGENSDFPPMAQATRLMDYPLRT